MVPLLPPRLRHPDGTPRCVSVELEFGGLGVVEASNALAAALGGRVRCEDSYRCTVEDTALGPLKVELDMQVAHPGDGEGPLLRGMRDLIGAVGSLWMPAEVTTGPLEIGRIGETERLLALRCAGAYGTRRYVHHAFGLQFNPELPDLEARTILAHMRAFALLAPRLRREIGVDLSRRLSPFIEPWPEGYVERLLDPGYEPDLPMLIDDYLDASPSRNRELDMLPLFAHLDHDRVRARLPYEKISARPTFHYRLPDSRVDDPAWTIAADWNRWVEVERLASDPARLAELAAARRLEPAI